VRVASLVERLKGEGIGAVLARGATGFLVIQSLGLLVSFGAQVVLARSMGADTYGVYIYAYNWMFVLLLLCRAGFGTASLRFVAGMAANEDWSLLRGYLRTSRAVVLLATCVVTSLTAVVAWLLEGRIDDALQQTFFVTCLAFPVFTFLQLWGFVLRGFKQVFLSQFPSVVLQPALLGGAALLLWYRKPALLDAPAAMALNVASAAVAMAFSWVALRRILPSPIRTAAPRTQTPYWIRVAAPLMLINAVTVAMQRTDILLVGGMLSAADAAIYSSATRIATLIQFGLTAVNAWAAPLISDLHARRDQRGLQRLMWLSARGIFALTLVPAAVVILFGHELLRMFGPEFEAAYTVLAILAVAHVVNALVGPVGTLMTMTGHHGTAAWILAVHAVLNLGLNFVLIPRHGIEGAAVATAATRVSWNVVMAVAAWRATRLRATIF
jgi:O-antigen/teichoic acid export membrane protein